MDTDQDFRLSVYDKTFDNIYNHGKILLKGSAGTWDSNKLDVLSLYWNLGIWYICYSAADANLYFKAGMATSYDCFNWSKYPLNPVIDGAELGQYTGVYSPTMIMVEKDFIIYISQRKTVGGALEIYKFDIV